ncbi:MAG: hypothetical protein SF123_26290 [Chloroflexota bacterium]|nr:hypothetical protein [Chloroflexota bacterium]
MVDTHIILSGIWATVMLIYLLGDVLRIYSGDMQRMAAEQQFTMTMWLGAAVLMVIPASMVALSLILPQPVSRWANIILAAGFFLFNLVALPTYPSAYDKFLLIVSLVFNLVTIWYAWNWAS